MTEPRLSRCAHYAEMLRLYETPYPVAFRKNVKGFVQIPLGHNYFEGGNIEG